MVRLDVAIGKDTMAFNRIVSMGIAVCLMLIGLVAGALQAADSRLQVINFSMDRCEPCRAMQPVLAKLIMDGWQIRHVDIAAEPKVVAQFKLQSAPTLVVLAGGRELDRVVGTLAYDKLLARLEAASRSVQSTSTPSVTTQALTAQGTTIPASAATTNQAAAPRLAGNPAGITAPPALPERSLTAPSLGLDTPTVRGQSPAEVDQPDIGNERLLDFVEDLPGPPKLSAVASNSLPANSQLASSTAKIGRAAVEPTVTRADQTPAVDTASRARLATVRIRVDDGNSLAFGTGTVIYVQQDQALVLTCGHMFRDISQAAKMSVDLFDSAGQITNVPAQVVSHSTEQGDIGLMEFRCPYPIAPVPIAKRAPALGDEAYSYGCDRGADPTRRDTQVKRINRYIGPANIEIHGAPVVGRSGGGLFNAQGQLIGVCNAADAEDDEGIYAALPVIEQHVAALRLENLPADDTVASNPMQLASAPSGNHQMTPIGLAASAADRATIPTQVRCVIRDAQGKETPIFIDRPSEELIAMLKQASRKDSR